MTRAAVFAVLLLGSAAHAQTTPPQTTPPQIPYTADAEFLHLPDTMHLGEVSGIAVNAQGHVFVFNRGNTHGPAYAAAAAQLLEFGADGTFIREVGQNLYAWSFAHDVKVDRDGNIWAADKGSDQVVRFNPAGRGDHGVRTQAGSLGRGTPSRWSTRSRRSHRLTDIFGR